MVSSFLWDTVYMLFLSGRLSVLGCDYSSTGNIVNSAHMPALSSKSKLCL